MDYNNTTFNNESLSASFMTTAAYNVTFNSSELQLASKHIPETRTEKIVYSTVIIFLFMINICTNVPLITVIHKFPLYQKPCKVIRTIIAGIDVATGFVSTGGFLWHLLGGYSEVNTKWACHTISVAGEVLVFTNMLCISLVAVERYVYLAYPLQYIRWMTSKCIVIFSVLLLMLPTVYGCVTEVIYGRKRNISTMACQLEKIKASQSIAIFILPSIFASLFSIFKLLWMRFNLQANIARPAGDANTIVVGVSLESFSKIIKTVVLLSCSLWLTFVPTAIVRVSIKRYFTWEELAEKSNMYVFIAMRICSLLLTLIPSALNPIIQFWLEEDLRTGFLRLVGIRRDFAWQRQQREVFNTKDKVVVKVDVEG